MNWNEGLKAWVDNGTVYYANGHTGIMVGHPPLKEPEPSTMEELQAAVGEQLDNLAKDPNKTNPCGEVRLNWPLPDGDTAMRHNSGKPSMHYILFFPRVTELLARIFEGGEHKYDYGNWRKGGRPDKEYMDCHMRHLFKLDGEGEMFDADFCTHHIGHAIWNLMVRFELGDDPIVSSVEDFRAAMLNMDKIKKARQENGSTS